jgi:Cu/Ag efflux protein CusF
MKIQSMLAAALFVVGSSVVTAGMDMKPMTDQPGMQATASAMSSGEVRKVDKVAKKITLKHGEVKNLGMPPMTMAYGVKDQDMLDKVKAGDKVLFSAADTNGALTITAIELVK